MALWRRRRTYEVAGRLDAEALVRDAMRSHQFRYWEVPEDAVLARVRALEDPSFGDALSAMYLSYAEQHGKHRWGDKTPQYVRSIAELSAIFPGSRFIQVIRDGRDVALSYLSLDWGPPNIWRAAHLWRSDVTAGRTAGRALGPRRYLELRYEDLVPSPEGALQVACRFLGLPFDPAMLEYHRGAEGRLRARPDTTASHASATRPPTEGLRDWRTQMPDDQVMDFESVAGSLLTELGYERRYPKIALTRTVSAGFRSRVVRLRLPVGPKIRSAPRRSRDASGGAGSSER
jgi:hypothetical protein